MTSYGEWAPELRSQRERALKLLQEEEEIHKIEAKNEHLNKLLKQLTEMLHALEVEILPLSEKIAENSRSVGKLQVSHMMNLDNLYPDLLKTVENMSEKVKCKDMEDVKALAYVCTVTETTKKVCVASDSSSLNEIKEYSKNKGLEVEEYNTPEHEESLREQREKKRLSDLEQHESDCWQAKKKA